MVPSKKKEEENEMGFSECRARPGVPEFATSSDVGTWEKQHAQSTRAPPSHPIHFPKPCKMNEAISISLNMDPNPCPGITGRQEEPTLHEKLVNWAPRVQILLRTWSLLPSCSSDSRTSSLLQNRLKSNPFYRC